MGVSGFILTCKIRFETTLRSIHSLCPSSNSSPAVIIDLVSFDPFNLSFITAHKRSLGQGNIFTGVCLSTGGVYVSRGFFLQGKSASKGFGQTPVCLVEFGRPPSPNQTSRRYASYQNTFLSVIQFVMQFPNFVAKLRKNIGFFLLQHSNFIILPGAPKSLISYDIH